MIFVGIPRLSLNSFYIKKANKPCDKNFTSTLSRNDGAFFLFFFFHFIISKLNIFRYLTFIYRHAAFIQNPLPLNSSFFFYLKTNKHATFNYSNEKIQIFTIAFNFLSNIINISLNFLTRDISIITFHKHCHSEFSHHFPFSLFLPICISPSLSITNSITNPQSLVSSRTRYKSR